MSLVVFDILKFTDGGSYRPLHSILSQLDEQASRNAPENRLQAVSNSWTAGRS
jgi:hypothetical protein